MGGGRRTIIKEELILTPQHPPQISQLLHRGICEDLNPSEGGPRLCLPKATYILNLTALSDDEIGAVSGTGYGASIKKALRNSGVTETRFNNPDDAKNHKGVKPHLTSHYSIKTGMQCLKEALRLLTHMYPELLDTIYFHDAPWWFHPVFKVFSLWVKKDTRRKFVFVKKGKGAEAFKRTVGIAELR